LGGTASSSAKFGFLNINSGTPTASISGNLALAVPTGATPANQLKLLNGGSFTIRISPGGDVGLEDAFQITKGGAILGTGNTTFGITPTSGAGNRMMWIPAKAAFRAGRAGGTHWDDSNIGNYSVAFGESARASGTHSFAAGIFTVASGNYSAALGYGNTASGTYAFVAGGNNSTAAGSNSLVLGNLSTANNTGSIVIGERSDSNANNAIVIGTGVDTLNHLTSSIANSLTIGFNSTVGTFFVGPGSGAGTYGNVGIGTTSIEGLFKVQGAKTGKALAIFNETGDQAIFTASSSGLPRFTITNQGGIMLGNSVGASNQCLLGGSTASWGSCGSGSSQWTDGTGGIYYNSGNVAIGTTDPSLYKFFVNGVGNSKALSVFAGDGNQDLFTASTSGITRFLIDKTGNIGIGTTLPSVRLHVVNNSTLDGSWNQGILVENTGGSSGEAAVTFKSALSSNYWFTGINGADVYDIAYGTGFFNSNVKFRINSNGQIGIATTNPSATLDVSGSASLSGDLTFRNTNVAHDINIFDGGSLTFRTSVGGNAVTKAAMTITNSGNIGIGTTAPIGKLNVDGAVTGKALVILNETGDQAILTASKSGSTKFLIDANGNVGIGTTNPTTGLEIVGVDKGLKITYQGNSTPAFLDVNSNGSVLWSSNVSAADVISDTTKPQWRIAISQLSDSFVIQHNNAGLSNWVSNNKTYFKIDGTGNIGIGTTAPIGKLNVDGAVTGKALVIFNETGDQAILTASKSGSTKFLIDANGNVGIGTTAPVHKLELASHTTADGGIGFGTDVELYRGAADTLYLASGDSLNLVLGNLQVAGTTVITSGRILQAANGTAASPSFTFASDTNTGIFGTGSDVLAIATAGTERLRVAANGNVGIGTTNTSNAMLSVSGTSLFQDQITVSNKGIEFTESDTNPTCATGNFNIYADLSENKLKKCQNGTVSDLDTVGGGGGSSGIVVKYKSANETVNNSATLQNDDDLFFSIGANETWTFRFVLFANSGTTPDLKAAVSAPSGASCMYAAIDAEAAVTTPQVTTCGTATAMLTGNGAYDVYEVVGTVVNGATAGTVTLQWAQNTATAANTIVAAGSYMHAFILVGSDLAELYYTNESDLVPGMVVSLDKNFSAGVVKAAKPYDTNTIGVVSTQPGLVIGEARERSMRTVPIALAGRIPVKVTNENGDIHAGDYLTSSSKPGYAMKATRSGPIIGQALEDAVMFDDHTGVVLMFVKNGFYFGSNVVLQDEKNMLGDLLLQNKSNNTNALNDGAISDIEALSSIITASKSDLLINLGEDGKVTFKGSSPAAITFDADGNAIFQGELTASKINGIIPGLTNLNDRMASLETTVATISALVASQSAIIEQYVIGTSASASLFNEIDSLLLDKKNAFEPSVFATEGVATISGNLRVKGTGLFESVVTILDALTTRQLISTGLATFLDDVLINGDTQFRGKVTFSQDTAGIVLVRKGSKEAVVIFKKPYQKPPIIHAAIMTDDAVNETLSAKILSENSEFIVTNVSKTGFKILLKKAAVVDIPFAWTAFVNAKE